MRTRGPLLLYHAFKHPIKGLTPKLTNPHIEDEDIAGHDRECTIASLANFE
jgi:hypothetical protein